MPRGTKSRFVQARLGAGAQRRAEQTGTGELRYTSFCADRFDGKLTWKKIISWAMDASVSTLSSRYGRYLLYM